MPNRILRDWTDSENVDSLSVYAERFFTRLIMKADDHGRYSANIKILKSTLFPLKTDVRETDITRWLTECKKSGLIVLYKVAFKDYLQIENFKQVLRQKHEKYPPPQHGTITCEADDKQLTSECVPETKGNESEKNQNGRADEPPPSMHSKEDIEAFAKAETWIQKHASSVAKMNEPLTIDQFIKLRNRFVETGFIVKVLTAMHNWKKLKERKSAYLTFLSFAEKEENKT